MNGLQIRCTSHYERIANPLYLAYIMSRHAGGVATALPVLGALALGAQRIIPALQQFYSGWATIIGSHASLTEILETLEQPIPDDAMKAAPPPLPFKEAIRFENTRFRFSKDGPWVLDGLDLTIPKGARGR